MVKSIESEFLEILQMGSERAVADLAVEAIGTDPLRFHVMLDYCYLEKYPISMRAARVVQLCCEQHPELIIPHIQKVTQHMITSSIDGVKRNFLKIMDDFLDPEKLADQGLLLDTCFNWLINPREKPATRVHCIGLILKLSASEPDIRQELRASVERILEDDLPVSLRNVCLKTLKKLVKHSLS
ncbi:MAG: hypothetical protein FJY10_10980 [Bacteroidetes bacterium]|nr:hypothetical protein [Bacteroidota bacterium]